MEADGRFEAVDKHLGYGTAGFRTKAEFLKRAAFRVGLVVGMRARGLNNKMGVMITASHN